MEKELNEIRNKFQGGKHKAIDELRTLIDNFPTDDLLYKAHDLLGDFLNFLGQHVEAVQSWSNALKSLEDNPGGIDQLNEQKFLDWIDISLAIARTTHCQGRDGSGVSHKYNSVTYASSKLSESEEEQWKQERFQTAIKHYKQVLDKLSSAESETKRKIQISLAEALFDGKEFDEAVILYENAFNNDGNPAWLYRAAGCSWEQGNKEQAYTRLQQLIATEPNFANDYEMCAKYFQEKNDTIKADEYTRQYNFYSWIPSFCHNIEYNTENVSILKMLQSEKALECVETTLTTDTSKRSTEFLASICYHHYHGTVENKAFEILEKRGKGCEGSERDFVGSILMSLINNHQSICTIKGAASALAELKYNGTFEVLANLLPQDINFYPMHIPMALAKLNDERAIPLLIKIIKKPSTQVEDNDSDSSDDFSVSGTPRLVLESYSALESLISNNRAKVEKMLLEKDTLDDMVIQYLQDNLDKSQYANELFDLNRDISIEKENENENEKNDDND